MININKYKIKKTNANEKDILMFCLGDFYNDEMSSKINIQIIEMSSNKIITEYPFEFLGVHEIDDYFTVAWEHAVAEGLADKTKRLEYILVKINNIF